MRRPVDPYTLERSVGGYRINKFLHGLVEPEFRQRFLADEEGCFEAAQLGIEERDPIRRRDWRGLIHHGAIFFVLEKLGALVGVSNLHIYAAMRGESLDDFRKTRNVPGGSIRSPARRQRRRLGMAPPARPLQAPSHVRSKRSPNRLLATAFATALADSDIIGNAAARSRPAAVQRAFCTYLLRNRRSKRETSP